jgi:transcriptional regulator with XRE-family HTH domain
MKKLGQNIRKLRELRNFTQQYMAEKLEMTQGNYARIENEEIHLSDDRLQKISGLLGYSTEFIIQFDVEKIHDMVSEKKDQSKDVFSFQISPELKHLYESRINSLESYVHELKTELRALKDQQLLQLQQQQFQQQALKQDI